MTQSGVGKPECPVVAGLKNSGGRLQSACLGTEEEGAEKEGTERTTVALISWDWPCAEFWAQGWGGCSQGDAPGLLGGPQTQHMPRGQGFLGLGLTVGDGRGRDPLPGKQPVPGSSPPAAELKRRLSAARCCPLLGTLRRPLSLRERLRVPRGLGGGRFGAMPPGIGCSGSALGLVGNRRGRLPSSAVGPRPRAFPAVPPSFPPRGGGWRSRCLRGLRRGVRPPALPVSAGL